MSSDQTWSTGPSVIAEPLLELNTVTKQFGGLTAVEAVTFKVYPGQIVSIIGPNGAGKTTVFNPDYLDFIVRLLEPFVWLVNH